MQSPNDDDALASITYRSPQPDDGQAMWRLARDSGALDLNSPYAYVLFGAHFAATSVVATGREDVPAGFVTAYRPPNEPDSVFVWQITVGHELRGRGVARRLLHEVLERAEPLGVRYLTATVTPSNEPSRNLFQAIAKDRGAPYQETPLFSAELFPGGDHEPEHRVQIGPL